MIDGVNKLWEEDKKYQKQYFGDFPFIASQHSLVAKHVTKDKWDQLKNIKTKTSGFTLAKAIACAVQFNNQHCGIHAGDWDSPRTSGTNSRTSRPRHPDSPWLRLLLALFNSTTSIAVSMPVTGTHTRTLLQFLIL